MVNSLTSVPEVRVVIVPESNGGENSSLKPANSNAAETRVNVESTQETISRLMQENQKLQADAVQNQATNSRMQQTISSLQTENADLQGNRRMKIFSCIFAMVFWGVLLFRRGNCH